MKSLYIKAKALANEIFRTIWHWKYVLKETPRGNIQWRGVFGPMMHYKKTKNMDLYDDARDNSVKRKMSFQDQGPLRMMELLEQVEW